jgi:hypothetical protein
VILGPLLGLFDDNQDTYYWNSVIFRHWLVRALN